MPDIPNRRKFERELTEGLSEALSKAQRELDKALWRQGLTQSDLATMPFSVKQTLQRNLQQTLQTTLTDVYITAATNFATELGFGVDADALEKSALAWAADYAGQVASDLVQRREVKLRELATNAPDVQLTRRNFLALLLLALGIGTVATIAVTEITNAISNGEYFTQQQLEDNGADVEEFWDTEEDERVCPICRPLHGKAKGDGWTIPPPAHPNCRCRKGYRVTSYDGTVSVVFSDAEVRQIIRKKSVMKKPGWSEADHPRADNGQFGSGGGGSSGGGNDNPSSGEAGSGKPDWAGSNSRYISRDSDGYMDYGHIDNNPSNAMAEIRERDISQQHVSNLDPKQQASVQEYAGESYRDINRGLRTGDDSVFENYDIDTLDSAIAANTIGENTVLYRGMTLNDDMRSQLQPGASFRDSAYTSTSFDQYNAERFSGGQNGATMRIRASADQNGVAMSSMSEYPEEREFLLPRDTEYRITGVTRDPDTGHTYVDAEIVRR